MFNSKGALYGVIGILLLTVVIGAYIFKLKSDYVSLDTEFATSQALVKERDQDLIAANFSIAQHEKVAKQTEVVLASYVVKVKSIETKYNEKNAKLSALEKQYDNVKSYLDTIVPAELYDSVLLEYETNY